MRLPALLFLCVFLWHTPSTAQSSPDARERQNLLGVVKAKLQNDIYARTYPHTPYFADFCGKHSAWMLCKFEVREPWAYVNIARRNDYRQSAAPDDLFPDGAGFLLKKHRGEWRVVNMGTDMSGEGAAMKVPASLWKKWNLE